MSLSTVTTGALTSTELISGVDTAAKSGVTHVEEGATVKAIYIELWVIGSVSNQFFTITLAKYPSNTNVQTVAEQAALGDWDNKRNIFYTTQGLASNDGIAAPIPVIRQWFKIPKGKARMGLGDKVRLVVASRGSDDIIFCGFATYKEYT